MSSPAADTARASRPDAAEEIAKPALLLASLASLGLMLTLGWQLVIAALFGTSAELDAFWVGAAIPKAIADSFHLGVLTLLFIVVYNMPRADASKAERDRLASSVFNAVMLGTLGVVVLLLAGAPWLVGWMAPGLDPEPRLLATSVVRRLSVLLIPTAFVGAMAGILNAHQRFAPFALSRVVGLALQIVVLVVAAQYLGTMALVAALIAGACAMWLMCIPSFRRTGFRYSPVVDFRGDEARAVLRMLAALVVLALLARANQVSDRYFASLLGEGAISALEFGWRFEIPVSQILAFSIALPAFALMALQASGERLDEFRETVGGSVRLTALLVAPVILFLVVMREPLAVLWFERGAFSPEAAQRVASLVPYLGAMFSVLAFGPVVVFGMLSLGRAGWLVGVLVLEVLGNTALNGPLSHELGVRGIALATTAAMIVSNTALWILFTRSIGAIPGRAVWARAWRTIAVCICAGLLLAAARSLLWSSFELDGVLEMLTALALLGVVYLAVYAALCDRFGLIRVRFVGGRPEVRLALGSDAGDEGPPR